VSQRLEELCGYYANRLSYENVAGLVERVTGENLLSDQTIWEIVKGKAETYSQQIRQTVQESLESTTSGQIQIKKNVEIYNVEESEILLFDDGIQVKGQKSERNSRSESTTHTPSPDTTKDKTPAVITDVAMLQTPKGGFEYLVAPLNTEVEEPISLATVVRARILALYQKESKPFEYCCYHQWGKSYSPSPLSYLWCFTCCHFRLVSPLQKSTQSDVHDCSQ
jgi:hypothetical protein